MTNLLRKNVFLLRAGLNPDRVLLIDSCEITPVSAETGRWFLMVSNPFTRSNVQRIYHENRNGGPDAPDAADDRIVDGQGSGPVSQNWTNGKIRLGRSL